MHVHVLYCQCHIEIEAMLGRALQGYYLRLLSVSNKEALLVLICNTILLPSLLDEPRAFKMAKIMLIFIFDISERSLESRALFPSRGWLSPRKFSNRKNVIQSISELGNRI